MVVLGVLLACEWVFPLPVNLLIYFLKAATSGFCFPKYGYCSVIIIILQCNYNYIVIIAREEAVERTELGKR